MGQKKQLRKRPRHPKEGPAGYFFSSKKVRSWELENKGIWGNPFRLARLTNGQIVQYDRCAKTKALGRREYGHLEDLQALGYGHVYRVFNLNRTYPYLTFEETKEERERKALAMILYGIGYSIKTNTGHRYIFTSIT
jgi:hypothetical protein|tara:strand:+ start:166 stop:576 length:411 start_codon:yes stop_codon:yes gene_type:complete